MERNRSEIKAIALDMDGTMLNVNSQVEPELVDLFRQLKQAGIRIFVATGRTFPEVRRVLPEHLEIDGVVTANGAVTYIGDQIISRRTLDPSVVREAVFQAGQENIYYEVHTAEGVRFALAKEKERMMEEVFKEKPDTLFENEWLSRKAALKEKMVWLDHLVDEDIVKIYFFSMEPGNIRKWRNALERMKNRTPFTLLSSSRHNCEIMADQVSKAYGLSLVLKEYQLAPAHLMAVGDSENDLSMFKLASRAVAMQNAADEIKEHADEVTKLPYDENGLYHFLQEEFFGS
ncbi:HAD family hydrolase [Thermoactinomyces sp. CICC 23799]|uniref:HAD family hydrolase n=1 Tax=Thermoactinomyces sp. CICC 23799 TaxID=2767429 RepID=UPI0018DD9102|nr:HAD family hydrolase [Thermoactinomyces sp. CICC 23799]MBH8602184.1 HAD family hydrolase [Thermoactinomyces sp. CICC 23799]